MEKQIVLVKPTNTIGVVIEQGTDPNGSTWYRTDCDGIREEHELAFIYDSAVAQMAISMGAQISPSTKKLIGL